MGKQFAVRSSQMSKQYLKSILHNQLSQHNPSRLRSELRTAKGQKNSLETLRIYILWPTPMVG